MAQVYSRILFIAVLLSIGGCAHAPESLQSKRPHQQTLFLALDGVPHELMKELYDEGHFQRYAAPSKVISTFPSVSSAGFGGLFQAVGTASPPGYDDKYFSHETKKVKGSIFNPHVGGPNEFQGHFDYYRSSTFQLLFMYATPGMSGYRDLKRLRKMIWNRPAETFYLLHIGATDGAGHILGRKRVKHWLVFMEDYLKRLRQEYRKEFQGDLKIVFFSDHGFHYKPPKGISKMVLAHRLRQEGYTLSNNLYKENHVVSVVLGNVSGASFYVHESHVPRVADILLEQKGMDLVMYRQGDRIIILSPRNGGERAEIFIEGKGKKLSYRPINGDPLLYEPVVAKLRSSGQLDSDGFASNQDWFEATADHRYPDAPYRLYDAFNGLVKNTASILCSAHPDYEFGGFWTRFSIALRGGFKGTHGGLFQETSAAFVMEDDPNVELPPALRYNDLMKHFFPRGLAQERAAPLQRLAKPPSIPEQSKEPRRLAKPPRKPQRSQDPRIAISGDD